MRIAFDLVYLGIFFLKGETMPNTITESLKCKKELLFRKSLIINMHFQSKHAFLYDLKGYYYKSKQTYYA